VNTLLNVAGMSKDHGDNKQASKRYEQALATLNDYHALHPNKSIELIIDDVKNRMSMQPSA